MRCFLPGRAVLRSASALRPAEEATSRCGEAFRICACWWSAATAPDWIRCRCMRCWRITASCRKGSGHRIRPGKRNKERGKTRRAVFVPSFPPTKTVIKKANPPTDPPTDLLFYFFSSSFAPGGLPPKKRFSKPPDAEGAQRPFAQRQKETPLASISILIRINMKLTTV